jgi:hypothetical protein
VASIFDPLATFAAVSSNSAFAKLSFAGAASKLKGKKNAGIRRVRSLILFKQELRIKGPYQDIYAAKTAPQVEPKNAF